MNLPKTYAVMRKETRHILRDRTTFLLLLFIPVFLMIIFAYSLAVDVKEVSITLLDYDRAPLSREFVAILANNFDPLPAWTHRSACAFQGQNVFPEQKTGFLYPQLNGYIHLSGMRSDGVSNLDADCQRIYPIAA